MILDRPRTITAIEFCEILGFNYEHKKQYANIMKLLRDRGHVLICKKKTSGFLYDEQEAYDVREKYLNGEIEINFWDKYNKKKKQTAA